MSKTLWIIDHYSSEPQYGGYTRQYNFSKGLSELGITVIVIASSFSHFKHSYISKEDYLERQVNEKVHYIYLKTDGYEDNSGIRRLMGMLSFDKQVMKYHKRIASHYGKPSWVVGSSPHIFTWQVANKISNIYGADFNIEVRDFWPLELRTKKDDISHRILYKYFDYIETKSFEKAKHIIGTMPYGHKYFDDFNKPGKEKFVFLGQPLDCVTFDRLADNNAHSLPSAIMSFVEQSDFCLFCGYYMEYEGVFQMLEAAKKTPDIKYVFVGSGNEQNAMHEYVKRNDISNVLIHGRVDKELIPALLKKSSICLAYIHNDDNPEMFKYGLSKNKLNEYMYSGSVTILGYDYDENEISDASCGFSFHPQNNEFTEIIRYIMQLSFDERKRLGDNGRKYIRQEHAVASLARKYIESILT